MKENSDALTVIEYRDHVIDCARNGTDSTFDIERLPLMFLVCGLENLYITLDQMTENK